MNIYKYIGLFFVLLCGFLDFPLAAQADIPTSVSVGISSSGLVGGFSVVCNASSTNATALLLHGDLPFSYSVYGYMRRPCTDGIVTFDNFDLNTYLNNDGMYPAWLSYARTPLTVVVKDTTDLYAPDVPLYHQLINLVGASNSYNYGVLSPTDLTYPTLAIGPSFDFNGSTWTSSATTTSPVPTPAGNSNVLFLPGLEASRLYHTKQNCVGDCEEQLWLPTSNNDVEKLYMNSDGKSKDPGVYTRDILNTAGPLGIKKIYSAFSEKMDELVQQGEINEWKPYAYDWRQDVQDIVDNGTPYQTGRISLIQTVKALASSSANGKVSIVAHSNGGLLAKALLVKLQEMKSSGQNDLIDHIDTVVLVAVPQLGTPSAVAAMLHGFDQSIAGPGGVWVVLNDSYARELAKNMPGAYGLLPSKSYIDNVSLSPVTFVDNPIPSEIMGSFVRQYGSVIDNYLEYIAFLRGQGDRTNPTFLQTLLPLKLSGDLLWRAELLHQKIDSWIPPSNVHIIQVAGWGIDTLATFQYEPKFECQSETPNGGMGTCGYILDERPIFSPDGDSTVVNASAILPIGEKWILNLAKINNDKSILESTRTHKNILEASPLINFISEYISDNPVSSSVYLGTTTPISDFNRLHLSVHSPVSIDAYDADGNHTGKICAPSIDFCIVEENIPNSSYVEFGEGKYLNLPEEKAKKIRLVGTDIGTFTYEAQEIAPNGSSTLVSYTDIPVTSQSVAEITINPVTNKSELAVDVTGDGKTDFTLSPQKDFDPVLYLQIMQKTIDSLDINQNKKDAFDKRIEKIVTLIQKNKIDKAKDKVKNISQTLEQKITKPVPKKPKPGKMSKAEAQLLLDMLNQLLDNIK